jgi:hypothetical protein
VKTSIMLRFPVNLEPRLEVLLQLVSKDAEFKAIRISQSALLRMLLLEGLTRFEERYGVAGHAD